VEEIMKLRSYQDEGVRHLMHKQRALLLDDMGLGKTAQAIVAFDRLGAKRVLIICPSATRYGWENEVRKWSTRDYNIQVLGGTKERIKAESNVVVCSYSLLNSPMLLDQLLSTRWTVTIVDEIHFCKNTKANRTKVVLGGRKKGIAQNSVHVWGMSGTPMTNAPIDLWPVFRSMGREHLPTKAQDYNGFTRIFCKRRKTKWGWDVSGSANLSVLHASLFKSGFALRRTKDEVLTELPEKTYRVLPMEMENHEAEIKWGDKLRKADLKKSSLGMDAGELAEARKDLAHDKLDAVVEYVRDIPGQVVIFGWHREFIEEMAGRLGGVMFYGGMSPKAKEKSKQKFLNGSAKYFVANIASAGTGLDGLQHVSSHCVFAEIPWTYAEVAQATDRLHRMGQKDPVIADLIVLKGGVESYIMSTVMKKEGRTEDLLLDNPKSVINI
jgi:SWI/SNF-related matrix-associated actin-dependent regulator 1 of chromatin subfamily A